MKIRLQATQWEIGNGITFDQFFNWIGGDWSKNANGAPKDIIIDGKTRIIATTEHGDFWLLLVLTVRDHRRYCEMRRAANGSIAIQIKDITAGSEAVDFNYFLCHKTSGRGVYSHYHRSCHFDDMTRLCREAYRELKTNMINADATQNTTKKNPQKTAEKKYAGMLRGVRLLTPQQLAELVATLHRITGLELTFGEVQVQKQWGQPIKDVVKVAKHIFRFDRNVPVNRVREKVLLTIERANVFRGKVIGEGEDGNEQIFKIHDNAGTFQELDFDNVAENLEFDFTNLPDSIIVEHMNHEIEARPAYFVTQHDR